ncbi:MAG: PASTA domain-containing protein [Mycobacteriales bacterium]
MVERRPGCCPGRYRGAAALSDVSMLRRLLDRTELNAVRLARRHGHSWAEVATRLGVTRQSAWERWRDLDDEPAETGSLQATAAAEAADELVSRASARRRRQAIVTVPDVVGLSLGEARTVLSGLGLVATGPDPDGPPLTTYGSPGGVVTDQIPESGAKVAIGSAVRLWTGRGGGSSGVREPRRPGPGPRSRRTQ